MADQPPKVPTRRTPDDFRREADELEAKAKALRALADLMEAHGAHVADLVRADVEESWALPSRNQDSTLNTMNASAESLARAVRGPRMKSKHPLALRAKELGRSIKAVSAELEKEFKKAFPQPTVRSWYIQKKDPRFEADGRPVPEDVAAYFERKPWGIPRSAWAKGIK